MMSEAVALSKEERLAAHDAAVEAASKNPSLSPETGRPVPKAVLTRFGIGFFVFGFLWCIGLQVVNSVLLPEHYKSIEGIEPEALLGIVNAWTAVASLVSNLMFGNFSDRSRSRFGRRTPWIVFGAGLGGGSSDGTAVLKALDTLFGLRLAEEELVARAAELGSDTAFFVRDTPQLCTGRGEVMTPFPLDLGGMTLVIVKPAEGVSTREAYAGVRPRMPEVPLAGRLRRPVAEWQGAVTNDFEEAAKEELLAAGALYASMSGSGSAVFGLFDDPARAARLRERTPFVFAL